MTTGADLRDLLASLRVPVVAAPMAGGPTTVALARAVADAGGLPFLAGAYRTPEALADEIEQVRATGRPFGVNLFVPSTAAVDEDTFAAYAATLQPEADRYGLQLDPAPVQDDDGWPAKLELLVRRPVPVVSLTFGLPNAADIAVLRKSRTQVLATVTSTAEATEAERLGVDGLVVQGSAAGGHSGTWDPDRDVPAVATAELVRDIRATTRLPLVAGGGVAGPESVRAVLAAGADAVAVGTLLLLADEAGTSATHRGALADPGFTETVLTRAFTGRPARALRNGFAERHGDSAPTVYPAVHHLTRPLRQAAAAAGDSDTVHLWAGTGWRAAPAAPAATIVRWLAGERSRPG